MKRPKMIISDIDGTLTDKDTISENILLEISRIQSLGIYFTFATGRPLMMVREIFCSLRPNCPVVINSGVEIYDPCEDSLTVLDQFEEGWVRQTVAYFQCRKIGVRLVKHNEIVTDLELMDKKNDIIYKGYGQYFKQLNDSSLDGIGKMSFFLREKEKIDLILDYFKKEEVNFSVSNAYGGFVFIDILPKNAGKHRAIEKIQASNGLASSDCIALVNDMNDLDLIRTVGFVVAPEDAPFAIKEKTDLIVNGIERDGMLEFLRGIR